MSLINVSLRQVYVFLCAAKHEHFTRAARELFMTQATVSRNIDSLEEQLGCLLFLREKQSVRLTEAGRILAAEWERGVRIFENAASRAVGIVGADYPGLTVGDFDYTLPEDYLLPVITRFESENPAAELIVERASPVSVLQGLVDGRLDAAFFSLWGQELLEGLGLECRRVLTMPACAVICEGNPVFRTRGDVLPKLTGQTLVSLRGSYELYRQYVEEVCESAGIVPGEVRYADNPHDLYLALRRGPCFAVADSCFAPSGRSGVRYLRLENAPESGVIFGASPANRNPYVRKLAELIRNLYQ